MKIHLLTLIISCLLFSSFNSEAQPGTLDASFGDSGTSHPSFGNYQHQYKLNAVAIQNDDKIVATGQLGILTFRDSLIVARYLSEGMLDTTFATNGVLKMALPLTDTSEPAIAGEDVIILRDSKIALGVDGYKTFGNGEDFFGVVKLNIDGTLDSTFGINGISTIFNNFGHNEKWTAQIKEDYKGRILLLGNSSDYSNEGATFSKIVLIRYSQNGLLDTSFNSKGFVAVPNYSPDDEGYALQFTPENKIMIGGQNNLGFGYDYLLARYNENGTIDTTFGTNGRVSVDLNNYSLDYFRDFILMPDNSMICAGYIYYNGSSGLSGTVTKLKPNGIKDSAFAANGIYIKPYSNLANYQEYFSSILSDSSNSIFVGGTNRLNVSDNHRQSYIMKFWPNGIPDSSFGVNSTSNPVLDSTSTIDIAVQSNGKFIAGGTYSNSFSNQSYFTLARYNNDAVLPVNITSFTATKKESSVLLNWKTCSEINSKGFYIERSINNSNWTSLGYVASKGGGYICNNEYSFTDTKPLNGNNLYRLKQADNDGKFTYSKTVSANFVIANHIKISPNPLRDILTIEGLNLSDETTLVITNVSGQVVDKAKISAETYNWNIQQLPSGTYYLLLSNNNKQTASLKFIKL